MKPIDTKKLEVLMDQGKWEEAKSLLDTSLASDLAPEERGAAYVQFASIYMRVKNELNRRYKESLEDAIGILKNIKAREKEVDQKISAGQVKGEIKKLYKKGE